MSDIQSHNGRNPSCLGSRDLALTKLNNRKYRSTAMLPFGKRQLALISSDMRMASLPPMVPITLFGSISLFTDILEARTSLRSLRLKMQEAAHQFDL